VANAMELDWLEATFTRWRPEANQMGVEAGAAGPYLQWAHVPRPGRTPLGLTLANMRRNSKHSKDISRSGDAKFSYAMTGRNYYTGL